jgi:ATP-dependent protease HslVU (ClpYQ) ATPase subunit
LFDVPNPKIKKITITDKKVQDTLKDIVEDEDLSRYIL